jgi:uncharacterized repeat protein (TIGR03847 family)
VSDSFFLDPVDRLTVGAVGPPGQRMFLIQARQGASLLTLKVEKTQVAALAVYLGDLLEEVGRPGDLPTDLDLEEPADPAWIVGTLGVSYEQETNTFVLVAEEAVPEETDGAVARMTASVEQVAALAIRGVQLVESGRPPCPLCGYPLDPAGHTCPRQNGHRPPEL